MCFLNRVLFLVFLLPNLTLSAQDFPADSLKERLKFVRGGEKASVLQNLAGELKYEDPQCAMQYAEEALDVLDSLTDKTLKAKTLGRISRIHQITGSYDSALHYARLFYDKSQAAKDTFLIANAHNYMGITYSHLGHYSEALTHVNRYIELSEQLGRKHHMGMGYNNMGNTYLHLGDYDRALENYMEFLRISEKLQLKKDGIPTALSNIALIYREIDSLNKALKHLLRAVEVSKEVRDRVSLSQIYSNIGKVYEKQEILDSARMYYQRAMYLSRSLNRQNGIASNLLNLADIENQQGNCSQALQMYHNAMDIYSRINDRDGKGHALYHIGRCYRTTGKMGPACEFLKKAEDQAQVLGDKILLRDCYHELYKVYEAWGKPAGALDYYKKYNRYSDSIFSHESADNIAKWQIRYRSKKKQQRITLLETQRKLQQARIKRQNLLLWALIIGAVFILGFSFIIYRLYRIKKRTNHQLAEQNREIAAQSRELEKANATKDKFFSIISHDLKSPFNSLLGLSDLLVRKADQMDPQKIRTFHQSIHNTTRHAYDLLLNLLQWSRSQLHQISIHPVEFDMSELVEKNIALHQQRAKEKGLELLNHVQYDITVFADYNMITTVVRNLLSNAIKFTGTGGSVEIDANDRGGFWEFQVRDTGMGISEQQIRQIFQLEQTYSAEGTEKEKGTGLGLVLCKEFISQNGGAIRAANRDGAGSIFSFTLPKPGQ